MLLTKKSKAKFFKALGIIKLTYLPFVLNMEPGNICNLKCPLCPTGQGDTAMKKGFLELDFFKEIFEQLKNSVDSVNFYSWGEPLLNKDFTAMLKYSKVVKPNVKITTSTNLNIRNNELLNDLIASGIDEIIVSCDGATEETYVKYRLGGDFNLVLENIRYLVEQKKLLKKDTDIVWNFLVFRHNEHEVETARKLALGFGVNFRIGLMRTSMKNEILLPHKEAIERDKGWIPDTPQYSAYDKEKNVTKKNIKTCRKPWQEISINWDGKIFPCCAVYGDTFCYGDATKEDIRKIWNNAKYITARQEILDRNRRAAVICGICRNNGFMHM